MKKYIVDSHMFQEFELQKYLNSDPHPGYDVVSVVNVGTMSCQCCVIWRLNEETK